MPEEQLLLSLPLAEDFHSYQGEGLYAGTPMHFIRTAGCNVGRNPCEDVGMHYELGKDKDFPILKTGHVAYRCHTHDGRGFWCDTDFHKGVVTDITGVINSTWENYICVTGGEPLLHRDKITELVKRAEDRGIKVHIETSGTIDWKPPVDSSVWITCSPKQGYLPSMLVEANEIKLLVDSGFRLQDVPDTIIRHHRVFIQPVNDELAVDTNNLELCHRIIRDMPNWRLSVQLHKLFGWR
jgi:7-carboxy-7-deazaguanine synthase